MKIRRRHFGGLIVLFALGVVTGATRGTSLRSANAAEGVLAANLSIHETNAPDPVDAGATLVYTLAVSNAGPDAATLVQVTNTLPAGAAYVGSSGDGWICSFAPDSGTVTCTLPLLAPGDAPAITLTLTAPLGGNLIENRAQVLSAVSDPDPIDNTSTQTTIVSATADLSIAQVDAPDPVNALATLFYTVNIVNAGPDTASTLTMTDTLPGGVVFESASGTGWTCARDRRKVTCTCPSLAVGAAPPIIITVSASATGGNVRNTTTISAATADPVSGNNSDDETTTVTPVADLSITKTGSPDPVTAGAILTYTLTASNAGPSSAATITVTDTLPAGVTFQSAAGEMWTCGQASGVVTCTRATIPAGASRAITITVRAPQSNGSLLNSATVAAATADPDTTNNTATATTTVTGETTQADLSILNYDAPDPVNAGFLLTYALNVANAGPGMASALTVTDTLPAGVVFESAAGTGWSCAQAAGTVTCTRASLVVGTAPTITIVVTAPTTEGPIENAASVASTDVDPDPANNSARAETSVIRVSDLSIDEADAPDPVPTNQRLTAVIAIANAGPADATSVRVSDTLPPGTTFVSASGSGWSCANASGTVTCTRPDLPPGPAPPIALTVKSPSVGGMITNNASVSGAEIDFDQLDNHASRDIHVLAPEDVHDIAVTRITPPALINLTAAAPSKMAKVTVQIQNRGGHQEVILDRVILGRLITLNIRSLGDCPPPIPVIDSFTLGKRNKLNVIFNVRFDCANDSLPATDGTIHSDYLYVASVHRGAIDGKADIHPEDDVCPRSVDPPFVRDPYPNATIKDRGCGKKKPDLTFGAPVLTDIVVK